MSSDGRYVVFESLASNLVPSDTNGVSDIFLRDRVAGTTERVSVGPGGIQSNDISEFPWISDDGNRVAFYSLADNLVTGDTNGTYDVFVRDRQLGSTQRVSISSFGDQSNGLSGYARISADGRFVAFYSHATNLVPGDNNAKADAFVHDLTTGITERISLAPDGTEGNGDSYAWSLSADGRHVLFYSYATNLVANDTTFWHDVFVRDRLTGTTEMVSVRTDGTQISNDHYANWISPDGRYVFFHSMSPFVAADTNAFFDVYLRDRQLSTTERASLPSFFPQPNDDCSSGSMSADGRYIAFASSATNLMQGGDTNGVDIFVRERWGANHFTSDCDPGANGVISCPCGNPPSGPDQGCDNSSATGGATLACSGTSYLSMDYIVFTTSGEKPTALSILLQGTASLPSGVIYGQGVRCVGGNLKRLYTKTASNGSITAPQPGTSDSPLTSRSAAVGDPIQPGQYRYYMVFYRDPTVIGGCSAGSTFNTTQAGSVLWYP